MEFLECGSSLPLLADDKGSSGSLFCASKLAQLQKRRRAAVVQGILRTRMSTTPHAAGQKGADAGLTPDRILHAGFAFWGSKALLSAVELGVFTELARGPLDREGL